MFRTVLFPIDQSRESREAAEVVAKLVKVHGSQRLVVLSVVEAGEADSPRAEVMTSAGAIAELLKSAQSLFAQQGVPSETLEREGKPAFVICDVADEIEADVIVMGCRGAGLTDENTGESVTSRVITLSPCPVLVVP